MLIDSGQVFCCVKTVINEKEFPKIIKVHKKHPDGKRGVLNFITAVMKPGKRLYRTLQNTSKFSITGKENRPDSDSFPLTLLNDGSIKNDWQHKIFGVHY